MDQILNTQHQYYEQLDLFFYSLQEELQALFYQILP